MRKKAPTPEGPRITMKEYMGPIPIPFTRRILSPGPNVIEASSALREPLTTINITDTHINVTRRQTLLDTPMLTNSVPLGETQTSVRVKIGISPLSEYLIPHGIVVTVKPPKKSKKLAR